RSFDYNANGVYLKCVVTDAHNITFTSNILTISIGGSAAVINSQHNNETTAKLSEELPLGVKSSNEFVLKQNSPNPFNPTTIINYQLPEDGFVSLKVFDVLGREIQTLVNDFRSKGMYSVTFDASNLASGIYLYRLSAKNFNSVKKMIVAK
ncbi:MAG: T9SS type A sorting domain-containing protein, partial [Bacteroidota bacterium]